MSFRLHYVLVLASLATSPGLSAQNFDCLDVIFRDTSVLKGITRRQMEIPGKYLLINNTINFQTEQARIDAAGPVTGKQHHDAPRMGDSLKTVFESIFSKQYLAVQKRTIKPIPILPNRNLYELIDTSLTHPSSGFYFAIGEPIFSRDSNYVYVELRTYRTDDDMFLWQQIFTETILIYRYSKEKGWAKFFHFDYPII